ncbi:MAG TPA: hypothetical protein VHY08_02830 [Bacillota bacterium]|nr:hypothetical protein [Bacillota bacterium]
MKKISFGQRTGVTRNPIAFIRLRGKRPALANIYFCIRLTNPI